MGILRAGIERDPVGAAIIVAGATARLHGHGVEPVIVEADPRDVMGICDGLLGRLGITHTQGE
jgi:hypothetical protein